MDTIDILHARVAELEATIKRGDAQYHGLIDERNYHQDRAERLLEELAEARRDQEWNSRPREERLEALLREVSTAGVELDDPRIGYLTVQLDRVTWDEIEEALR